MQILGRRNVQHLPTMALIGEDPNNNREDIKKELLKRVNEKGHKAT